MKCYNRILFISLLTMLSACNSKPDKQVEKLENSKILDSVALVTNQSQMRDSIVENAITCARGQAEPVIKKKYFPDANFVLQPDRITAVETVSFKNGDTLLITNWGCESYILTFCFETSRFKAYTSNLKYWYAAASKLMNEAVPGIDAPLDIKEGVRALNSYAAKNAKHLSLQSEINFNKDEAARIVTLDSIAEIRNNRTAVILSFTAGLL